MTSTLGLPKSVLFARCIATKSSKRKKLGQKRFAKLRSFIPVKKELRLNG